MNSRLTECTKMRSEPARSHGSHHAAAAGASVVCINTDSLIYILFLTKSLLLTSTHLLFAVTFGQKATASTKVRSGPHVFPASVERFCTRSCCPAKSLQPDFRPSAYASSCSCPTATRPGMRKAAYVHGFSEQSADDSPAAITLTKVTSTSPPFAAPRTSAKPSRKVVVVVDMWLYIECR